MILCDMRNSNKFINDIVCLNIMSVNTVNKPCEIVQINQSP